MFKSSLFIILGILLILLNKPFGKACQSWQNDVMKNDYPILSFRLPILLLGAIVIFIGVLIGFF